MNNKIKFLGMILCFLFIICLNSNVEAGTGSFSISASQSSLKVGQATTLKITTTNAEGKFSISSSNSGVVSVSPTSEWVSSSSSITLTAKSAGTATITVNPETVSGTDLELVTGAKTVTITVTEEQTTTTPKPSTPTTTTKSSDATLKSITIGTKSYSGSSLNNTITHTVEYGTSSIKISASKSNSKATISGTGTKSLTAGQTNQFKITVTAEDGTKKEYKVNIVRLAEENTTPNIIEEETPVQVEELKLGSLFIKDVEISPEFSPDVLEYTAQVENLDNLEIDATANKEGAVIEIEGAENLQEGENVVKITVKLGEESKEYIITVNKTIQSVIGITDEGNGNINEGISNFELIKLIIMENLKKIFLITAIIVLAIIAIICAVMSYRYSVMINKLSEQQNMEVAENIGVQEKKSEPRETSRTGRHF